MIVVNLFGAPGSGKSTGSAYIFSQLKMAGVNAELITEFAKDKVYEDNKEVFKPDNQLYLLGKQFFRMSRCRDKVDVLVSDSPLALCAYYNIHNGSAVLDGEFNILCMNVFNSFNNMNYYLNRIKPYNPSGRLQTEAEAAEIDKELRHFCKINIPKMSYYSGDKESYQRIIREIMDVLS